MVFPWRLKPLVSLTVLFQCKFICGRPEGVARYRLHNVMREQLQALLQKDEAVLFREVHEFLFRHYDHVFERVKAIEQQVLSDAGLESKYFDYAKFQELAKPVEEELQGLYERFDDALVEGLYHLERLEVMRLAEWLGTRNHLYYQLAKYSFSQPLWQHTLLIIQSQIGEETDEAALCMNNLAELYRAQGQYEQAKPLYERALGICEQVLGANHPDTATSLNNLAGLYYSQRKYDQAEPLYERALGICEQVLGANHPDTERSLNNLAALYYSQRKYDQAAPLYERALGICEQVLGVNHPDTAQSLNNLAGLYYSQGHYGQAEPLYERALAILTHVLGENHPTTQTVRNNYEYLKVQMQQNSEQS